MDVDGIVLSFEPRWEASDETTLIASISTFEPLIIDHMKENQKNDLKITKIFEQIALRPGFEVVDGVLHFKGRLCVPNARYSIHLGSTTMF